MALEYLPSVERTRVTLKSEIQGGEERRGSRFDLSADMPFSEDIALMTRHDWSSFSSGARGSAAAEAGAFVQQRSIVGLALRPTGSDMLNVIGKVEWRRNRVPTYSESLADTADRRRFIGAVDAIWTPAPGTEASLRYAIRYSGWSRSQAVESGAPIAHYVGSSLERALPRRILDGRAAVRLDARYLLEQASEAQRWSIAPSAVFRLTEQLHVEAGWRAGGMQDGDFGATGGGFVNFGARVTEDGIRDVRSFWRKRM